MLAEYRAWLHKMPLLSHELLPRLCEILREFNSEVRPLLSCLELFLSAYSLLSRFLPCTKHCSSTLLFSIYGRAQIRRLVLDAAAVHAAGLKRITAKQLGLASEAIAIVAAIIPNLQRDCGASLSDSKQVRPVPWRVVTW